MQIKKKEKNIPCGILVHYALRTILKLRYHRNRIATSRANKRPARTRAGIKHPFLHSVDRN